MISIELADLEDEKLKAYHDWMVEGCLKISNVPSLAVGLWTEVLKELDRRKLVRLISGSYEDVGNARMQKLW